MSKRRVRSSVANVCTICGETFYSAQPAKFCTTKSTCRVKFHQAKRMADKIAATFTMNLETMLMYQRIVTAVPEMKLTLDAFIFKNGMQPSEEMLIIVYGLLERTNEVERL